MGALLKSLSYKQLREWQAYAQIEPFGEKRADLRIAQLCSIVANMIPKEKGSSKTYEPADFMPEFFETEIEKRRKKREKGEAMMRKFRNAVGPD